MKHANHHGLQADTRKEVFRVLRGILVELATARGLPEPTIELETSIIEDLGLDSLAMVDVTILLERRLGITKLPMQAWLDAEAMREGSRYTVTSLIDECSRHLRARDDS